MVQVREKKTKIVVLSVASIFLSMVLVISLFGIHKKGLLEPIGKSLRSSLQKELTSVDREIPRCDLDMIYVLGGGPRSLMHRFRKAANIYHRTGCRRILILSRPGKTVFSPSLGRNLTNNEWAVLRLQELGIPEDKMELVIVKGRLFGTLREAETVSQLIKNRGYENVVLVSSSYHTRRVRVSFEKYLRDTRVNIFVQGSNGEVAFTELMADFIKLIIYKCFLVW